MSFQAAFRHHFPGGNSPAHPLPHPRSCKALQLLLWAPQSVTPGSHISPMAIQFPPKCLSPNWTVAPGGGGGDLAHLQSLAHSKCSVKSYLLLVCLPGPQWIQILLLITRGSWLLTEKTFLPLILPSFQLLGAAQNLSYHTGCSGNPGFSGALPGLPPSSAFCPRRVVGCRCEEAWEWGEELSC